MSPTLLMCERSTRQLMVWSHGTDIPRSRPRCAAVGRAFDDAGNYGVGRESRREFRRERSELPSARVGVTVPSGCSHVMVPLDVTDGCDGVPLTICSNIICVQSYLTRPCVAPSSNRRPPVIRTVEVTLDVTPSAPRTITCSPASARPTPCPWASRASARSRRSGPCPPTIHTTYRRARPAC